MTEEVKLSDRSDEMHESEKLGQQTRQQKL